MNFKRLGSGAVLLILLALPVSASTVSFLMVETGLSSEFSGTQHTSLWEGGLMEAFFNAGHIVTNSPILRMERRPSRDLSGSIKDDLDDAALSGVDYFVLGFLDYQIKGENALPVGIVLKIYATGSRNLVYEQNFPAGRGKNLNEEFQFAQNAGRIIISHIKDR